MAFEVFKGKGAKKYYFRLKAGNGQIILASEAYASKAGIHNAIWAVKRNAKHSNFETKNAKDGRTYFVLKARNGEVIGTSQMYKSNGGVKKGIQAVIDNTRNAKIEEALNAIS